MDLSRFVACSVSALLLVSCATAPKAAEPPALPTRAAEKPAAPGSATQARVARIVDGDTIVLSGIAIGELDPRTGGRRARLIGIDTPEVHGGVECLGRESSDFAERELLGTEVLVDFDVDRVDRHGRALVYVWTQNGTFFNGRIVAEGFALPFTVPPNVRYSELFILLAARAREAKRGLWTLC